MDRLAVILAGTPVARFTAERGECEYVDLDVPDDVYHREREPLRKNSASTVFVRRTDIRKLGCELYRPLYCSGEPFS